MHYRVITIGSMSVSCALESFGTSYWVYSVLVITTI